MGGNLITEEEAAKMLFSKQARPTPSQMARLRRTQGLPAIRLGRRVLYWADELEDYLRQLPRPQ